MVGHKICSDRIVIFRSRLPMFSLGFRRLCVLWGFLYEEWVIWCSLVSITIAQLGRSMVGLPPWGSGPNVSAYLRPLQSGLLIRFALPFQLCYALNQAASETVEDFTRNPGQGPLEGTDSRVSWAPDIFEVYSSLSSFFQPGLGQALGELSLMFIVIIIPNTLCGEMRSY
jgi:hypothetical protein